MCMLIRAGAGLEAKCRLTPACAALCSAVPVVRLPTNVGANSPALILAVMSGHVTCLQQLLKARADMSAALKSGQTALDLAILYQGRSQCVDMLRAEDEARTAGGLEQLVESGMLSVTAPGGTGEVSLSDLLSTNDHVGLILGDGNSADKRYTRLYDAVDKVNGDKANQQQVIYVAWSLHKGGDHSNFARLHSVFHVSAGLRTILSDIAGSGDAPSFINLRRCADLCSTDGTSKAQIVPELVARDPGMRFIAGTGPCCGAFGYPWSEERLEAINAENRLRIARLKARLPNLDLLKSDTGEDNLLVRTQGSAPTVGQDLATLGDSGVVGIYFSAQWNPQCRQFTPVLLKCYEQAKAQGKPLELVLISFDNEKESFEGHLNTLVTSRGEQVAAVAFKHRHLKQDLTAVFGVQGIPALVLLKPDGSTITDRGIEAFTAGADLFPWHQG